MLGWGVRGFSELAHPIECAVRAHNGEQAYEACAKFWSGTAAGARAGKAACCFEQRWQRRQNTARSRGASLLRVVDDRCASRLHRIALTAQQRAQLGLQHHRARPAVGGDVVHVQQQRPPRSALLLRRTRRGAQVNEGLLHLRGAALEFQFSTGSIRLKELLVRKSNQHS